MFPNQKFDQPGKSPFMDMQLVPKYADGSGANAASPGISVDASARQSPGIRVVAAELGSLAATLDGTGPVAFNHADLPNVQARPPTGEARGGKQCVRRVRVWGTPSHKK